MISHREIVAVAFMLFVAFASGGSLSLSLLAFLVAWFALEGLRKKEDRRSAERRYRQRKTERRNRRT